MNSYTKSEIKEGRFISTRVQEEEILNLQIKEVSGDGIITHIGAYKRIKFTFKDKTYLSECGNDLALDESNSECISLNNINFDKHIDSNWKRYIFATNPEYWIEAI